MNDLSADEYPMQPDDLTSRLIFLTSIKGSV